MSYASDMKKELTLIEITQDREFLSELSAFYHYIDNKDEWYFDDSKW